MAVEGNADSMYLTLTSDACLEIFPNNKPSEFSIQLGQQTVLDSNSWEVGLYSIAYPFDFNTVGPDCYFHVKYRNFLTKIVLPEWHCARIQDLCTYLTAKLNEAILGVVNTVFIESFEAQHNQTNKEPKSFKPHQFEVVRVLSDSTNRISFYFDTRFADLGFSDRLMQILGFSSQPEFSEDNFLKRQKFILALQTECVHERFDFDMISALEKRMHLSSGYSVSSTFESDIESRTGCNGQKLYEIVTRGSTQPPDIKLLFPDDDGEFLAHLKAVEQKGGLPAVDRAEFDELGAIKRGSKLHKRALVTFAFLRLIESFHIENQGTFVGKHSAVVNPFELMYIYTDIIKPQPFNNFSSPVLDILKTEGRTGELTEYRSNGNIQYKPLNRSNITTIKTLIASEQGKPFPFLRGPLVIRLHFRRRSRHF